MLWDMVLLNLNLQIVAIIVPFKELVFLKLA
jgi:hypothetical protein